MEDKAGLVNLRRYCEEIWELIFFRTFVKSRKHLVMNFSVHEIFPEGNSSLYYHGILSIERNSVTRGEGM